MQEELVYCAGDHALEQIASLEVSVSGNIQELSGQNPVQCALGSSA